MLGGSSDEKSFYYFFHFFQIPQTTPTQYSPCRLVKKGLESSCPLCVIIQQRQGEKRGDVND